MFATANRALCALARHASSISLMKASLSERVIAANNRRMSQMLQIFLFSISPRQFLFGIAHRAVRARLNSIGYAISKQTPDRIKCWEPSLILNRVVQQSCDCLIFVSASLKNQAGNCHQVCDVRYCRPLSMLFKVQSRRNLQRKAESTSQER